jgi:acetyl/propionyl-CoA carboxylase alpha subunit
MTFEIELGGRSRRVAIEPAAGTRFRVTVDDAVHVVDAVRIGSSGLSLLLDGDAGASHYAEVVAGPAGESLVWLDGQAAGVMVDGRARRRSGDAAAHGEGAQSIVAPMPGRVVKVLVAPGDAVAARQPLVVVEAMKMENELASPKAGTIKEVAVAEGASVEAGRLLVVVQ